MDFGKFKRTSSKDNFDQLQASLEKGAKSGGNFDDEGFWRPTLDKAGNGSALIRFLPAPPCDGDDALPYVRYWSHRFKGPGGWYSEKCLSTKDRPDPCCEANSALWDTGIKANQDVVRGRKRNLHYVSNILVVRDPAHPENDGKIFKYRYGKTIYQKIMGMAIPDDSDFEAKQRGPVNVFDFWKGADFKLKIRSKTGSDGKSYPSPEESTFQNVSALFGGDDKKLEALWKSLPSLLQLVAEDQFKDYDELQSRLTRVLSGSTPKAEAPKPISPPETEEIESDFSAKAGKTRNSKPPAANAKKSEPEPTAPWEESTSTPSTPAEDDDSLDYFAKLANDGG